MRIVLPILVFHFATAYPVHLNLNESAFDKESSRNIVRDMVPIIFGGTSTVNKDSWFCGASSIQWTVLHNIMSNMCNEKLPEVNYCCAVHDTCYDHLLGSRENCDNHFCECLDRAMNKPNLEFTCSRAYTDTACTVVKQLGGTVYGGGGSDIMVLISYHPALNQTANAEYNRLYKECEGYRKPLISCAYNHLVCTLQMLPVERYNQEYPDCRENLLKCLDETSDFLNMKNNVACSKQLDVAIEAIKDDARVSELPESYHYKINKNVQEAAVTTGNPNKNKYTPKMISIDSDEEDLSEILIGGKLKKTNLI
uniref:Phospholipase A(2) n=1 Tax=Caenorhabditis tropicalis TaxID=1561998 RepID=A0A1I7T478_9PELO